MIKHFRISFETKSPQFSQAQHTLKLKEKKGKITGDTQSNTEQTIPN